MNCDGAIDSFDVSPFILAMTNPTLYEQTYPNCNILNGDLNGDGAVDSFDLDLFTALLLGSGGAGGLRVKYTWNAENRLTAVTPVSPQAGDKKVEFAYDYMGRRIEKKVSVWNENLSPPDWDDEHAEAYVRRFVWSGWLKLMELDGNGNSVRKYTWGLDLSQTLSGAGGIGGLLAVDQAAIDYPDPKPDILAGQYVYLYDANGNVGQLVAWASGFGGASGDEWHADRLVAHYEYDPYGNVVNQTGAYAEENPFRFSTKYFDDETGLGYWGYRYYSPRTGRWLSRDPLEEEAGLLLYAYVGNNPASYTDLLGLLSLCDFLDALGMSGAASSGGDWTRPGNYLSNKFLGKLRGSLPLPGMPLLRIRVMPWLEIQLKPCCDSDTGCGLLFCVEGGVDLALVFGTPRRPKHSAEDPQKSTRQQVGYRDRKGHLTFGAEPPLPTCRTQGAIGARGFARGSGGIGIIGAQFNYEIFHAYWTCTWDGCRGDFQWTNDFQWSVATGVAGASVEVGVSIYASGCFPIDMCN